LSAPGDEAGGVAPRPREARDESAADRIGDVDENDGDDARSLQQRRGRQRTCRKNEVGLEGNEFLGKSLDRLLVVGFRPAHVDPDAATFHPAELLKALPERRKGGLGFRVAFGITHQHADPSQRTALLRSRRERPCRQRPAESPDEFASPHPKTEQLPVARVA
jgi:hypothetical protein